MENDKREANGRYHSSQMCSQELRFVKLLYGFARVISKCEAFMFGRLDGLASCEETARSAICHFKISRAFATDMCLISEHDGLQAWLSALTNNGLRLVTTREKSPAERGRSRSGW